MEHRLQLELDESGEYCVVRQEVFYKFLCRNTSQKLWEFPQPKPKIIWATFSIKPARTSVAFFLAEASRAVVPDLNRKIRVYNSFYNEIQSRFQEIPKPIHLTLFWQPLESDEWAEVERNGYY